MKMRKEAIKLCTNYFSTELKYKVIATVLGENKWNGHLRTKPRNAVIFLKRYGLLNNEPATLDALGSEFKITRARVDQVVKKTAGQIRWPHYSKSIMCHDEGEVFYKMIEVF